MIDYSKKYPLTLRISESKGNFIYLSLGPLSAALIASLFQSSASLDYNQPQLGDLNILEVNNSDYFFA